MSKAAGVILSIILAVFYIASFTQCANIMPPMGGPVDSIPPRILKITPSDSSLNIRPDKIEITFDKYMELGDWSTLLTVSPLLPVQPQITVQMKKVVITIADTALLDNTTYTIALGDALKDNREGTPYNDFHYTFSTGAFIDSLSLSGAAVWAHNLKTDSGFWAVLYDTAGFQDSFLVKKKPLYVTRVKEDGVFEFRHLPAKGFRMFVIHDTDNDRLYNPLADGVAFIDSVFEPASFFDTIPVFKVFRKELDSLELVQKADMSVASSSEGQGRSMRRSGSQNQIPKEGYTVLVDTSQNNVGTQDISQPLKILYNPRFIDTVIKDRIFLSFEKDEIEVQALADITIKDSTILLDTEWQDDVVYTLRLIKGWSLDTAGLEVFPNRYSFRSKKKEDYSQLTVIFGEEYWGGEDHVIGLYNGEDSVGQRRVSDSLVHFDFLVPGRSYNVYLTEDMNQDGRWTSGDYFKGIQPETVFRHYQPIQLRAGWTNEEKFKMAELKFNFKRRPVEPENEEEVSGDD